MCSVTEARKASIQSEITALQAEQTSNQAVIDDATQCISENQAAVSDATCAQDALEPMELGSDRIMNSINSCLTDLNDRIETQETIKREAEAIQQQIAADITAKQAEYDAVPENCGWCSECKPDNAPGGW